MSVGYINYIKDWLEKGYWEYRLQIDTVRYSAYVSIAHHQPSLRILSTKMFATWCATRPSYHTVGSRMVRILCSKQVDPTPSKERTKRNGAPSRSQTNLFEVIFGSLESFPIRQNFWKERKTKLPVALPPVASQVATSSSEPLWWLLKFLENPSVPVGSSWR